MKHAIPLLTALILLAAGWYYTLGVLPDATRSGGYGYYRMADLYPIWRAVHEVVLENKSPYYEATPVFDTFAYPLFAVFPFAPLILVEYPEAQQLAFVGFVALSLAALWLWTRSVTACLFGMAAFPITMGIAIRQPAVLILFFMALSIWAARKQRFLLAGAAAALATAKPQLALAVLIPLLFWTIADWTHRKLIAFGFFSSFALLMIVALSLQPHWIQDWLHRIGAYRHYANATPLIAMPWPVITLLAALLLLMLWHVRGDLDYGLALSVAGSQFLLPFQAYHLALLFPALIWIWERRDQLEKHLASRLIYRLGFSLLALAFAATIAACAIPALWQLPALLFSEVSLVPMIVLIADLWQSRDSALKA